MALAFFRNFVNLFDGHLVGLGLYFAGEPSGRKGLFLSNRNRPWFWLPKIIVLAPPLIKGLEVRTSLLDEATLEK